MSSFSDYKNYLLNHLPEYELDGIVNNTIPSRGKVALKKKSGVGMKYGSTGTPAYKGTEQPLKLEFDYPKRLGQIKHFRQKRDKIIAYLQNDCPRKDLVLKKYDRWDKFTVGTAGGPLEDQEYVHLAKLKEDTKSVTSGFMFCARRFFGLTTPTMKKALIEKYMEEHCRLHELVHFEHNNLFFIARKDTTTGLGSGTNNIEGIFHYKNPAGEWVDVQGTMLTSYSQLANYCTDISGPLSNLWNEHKIAAEVKKYTKIMEDAGFAGRDEFQMLVRDVTIDSQGGLAHDVKKAVKEKLFGKHCRTHPVRAVRTGLSNMFKIVKAALPSFLKEAGFAAAKKVSEVVIERSQQVVTSASTVSTVSSAVIGEKAVPQWVQDMGLSPSDDELNKTHWDEIQNHIDSLQKWEERFIALEDEFKDPLRPKVVTCQQMNDLLRFYAKVQFHTEKLVECYGREVRELEKVAAEVRAVKLSLSAGEDQFKKNAVKYLNEARNKKLKTKKAGTPVDIFTTGSERYKVYNIENLRVSDATLENFMSANAELRDDPSAVDNDAGEIDSED